MKAASHSPQFISVLDTSQMPFVHGGAVKCGPFVMRKDDDAGNLFPWWNLGTVKATSLIYRNTGGKCRL